MKFAMIAVTLTACAVAPDTDIEESAATAPISVTIAHDAIAIGMAHDLAGISTVDYCTRTICDPFGDCWEEPTNDCGPGTGGGGGGTGGGGGGGGGTNSCSQISCHPEACWVTGDGNYYCTHSTGDDLMCEAYCTDGSTVLSGCTTDPYFVQWDCESDCISLHPNDPYGKSACIVTCMNNYPSTCFAQ